MKFCLKVENIEITDQPVIVDMGDIAAVNRNTYLNVGLGPCVFHMFPFWDYERSEIRFMTYHRPPRVLADSEYFDPLRDLRSFYELRDEISPGTAIAWIYNSVEGTAEDVYSHSSDKKHNNPLAVCCKSEYEV